MPDREAHLYARMLVLLVLHCTSRLSAIRSNSVHMLLAKSSPSGRRLEMARKEIADEALLERQATLVELPVMFSDEPDESSFDFDRWAAHRGSSRYGRLLLGILLGVTTRRISFTVLTLVAFSGLVGLYAQMSTMDPSLPEVQLPLTPFELTAPVLGLLLVFRTNTAYDRFDKGSDASWALTGQVRSVMRQLAVYTASPSFPASERQAAIEMVDAIGLLHGWLMEGYLRGEPLAGEQLALLRLTLGDRVSRSRIDRLPDGLTPAAALAALSMGLMRRLPSLEVNERIAVDAELTGVTTELADCEKLLRTPIPLGYTRYSVRVCP